MSAALRRFLAIEASASIVLLAATLLALLWANSPWAHSYGDVWQHAFDLAIGPWERHTTPGHLVNDALMAVFFLVVGMELRSEWSTGELQDRRAALLPAAAALGGMVVPALVFSAIVAGGPGSHGWGIPMATDIAFALGVLGLLGGRIPVSLKVFLLTLAIVDDLGAIVVIAVFYAGSLSWGWLLAAAVGLLVVVAMQRLGVRSVAPFVVVGVVVWFATWQSGVHATLAAVLLGLLTPDTDRGRLEAALHPWSSYVVLPLFALANAGVALSAGTGGHLRLGIAVAAGLVIGKILGITIAAWVLIRTGLARLPSGSTWSQFCGVAALAGIGFTMSLFVTELAFAGPDEAGLATATKLGIFAGSLVAAWVGAAVLGFAGGSGGRRARGHRHRDASSTRHA